MKHSLGRFGLGNTSFGLGISDYANDMSQELYNAISEGRADFLRDHKRFQEDITKAVEILEKML